MIRNDLPLILIGKGDNKIQFISVDDLCLIIKKSLHLKKKFTFNVTQLNHLLKRIMHIIKNRNQNQRFHNELLHW